MSRYGSDGRRDPMTFWWFIFGPQLPGRRRGYLWDLLTQLMARDLKLRYQRSILGFAWTLVNPLILLLVFYFLFHLVLSVDVRRFSSFTFIGILAWFWFSSSLTQAVSSITQSRELLRRPGFPVPILPVVSVSVAFIHFVLSLPILLFLILLEGEWPTLIALTLPVIVGIQFLLSLSLGYVVAAANVLFRDTRHMLTALLQVFFFLSPVFYDPSVVPEKFQPLYNLNPMVHILGAYRNVLLKDLCPDMMPLLGILILSIGILHLAFKGFLRVSDRFVEEL